MLPPPLAALPASLLPLATTPDPVRGPLGERRAAVLVLLFPRDGTISFLLTARPHTLSRHPSQISLPGGAVEPGDISLWEAALRETREELGMATSRVQPLGRLEEVPVAVSRYVITPFVGWIPRLPTVRPDPGEVAEVIEVPLAALLDPAAAQEEVWELRGGPWRVSFYRFGDRRVWGATARVLSHLSCRLRPPGAAVPYPPGSVRPA